MVSTVVRMRGPLSTLTPFPFLIATKFNINKRGVFFPELFLFLLVLKHPQILFKIIFDFSH